MGRKGNWRSGLGECVEGKEERWEEGRLREREEKKEEKEEKD